jgi:plastocyanin
MRRLSSLARVIGAAALVAWPALVWAVPVSGVVRTATRNGTKPAAPVVYAERLDVPSRPQPGRFTLAQRGKAFVPALLAIPAGSTVDFPNRDPIFHNVFSLSSPSPFDLGLYRSGDSRTRTFAAPAAYRVFCNIHPHMTAFIIVVPTSYVAVADASGAWTLDLPAGRYRLVALSERAAPTTVEVHVSPGATTPVLTLDETGFVAMQHPNKFGRPYSRSAYSK